MARNIGYLLLMAAMCAAVCYMANRTAVYHPFRYPKGFWDLQPKLGVADIWLRASDGVRLHAWWAHRPELPVATLFLHGNAGNVTHRADRVPQITAAGSSLLLLDYRGYGKSEGQPSEKALYIDADAAYQYLLDAGYSPRQIVIHGESLGTAVSVDLAARRPCAGVILEAPFTSARGVASHHLPGIGPLLVWGFDSKAKIANVRAPLLVIHGDGDDVIPFELGKTLFEAAPGRKTFWAVPRAGHNDLIQKAGAEYRERLREFYASAGI